MKKRIYLDFASSTPVDSEVRKEIASALTLLHGNPSAPHQEGREARIAVEAAREKVARSFAVKPEEIVFTSGGTESNVLAIRGLIEGLGFCGVSHDAIHIVTTTIEHSSILGTLRALESRGVTVTRIKPGRDGVVKPIDIENALRPNTALITIAHVNSETGTIQPLPDIGAAVRRRVRELGSDFARIALETVWPVLHADCAQSPLYLEAGPHALRVQLASYDAQKVMGPKGVGVLFRDYSVPITSILGGGTQERGVRPGTENVAGVIGAGVAFERAAKGRAKRALSVSKLRDLLIRKIADGIPEAVLLGSMKRRIANNAFFAIPGVQGDYLAVLMDREGIAVTPRSACVGSSSDVSHVALEITGDKDLARGTIRFSLGPKTTRGDVESAVRALKKVLRIARVS